MGVTPFEFMMMLMRFLNSPSYFQNSLPFEIYVPSFQLLAVSISPIMKLGIHVKDVTRKGE
jgi:hypothetical protein